MTYYVEPFGNMVIEANLCGTPAITTDWGGFTETVLEGKTGYRIRDFKSLLTAIESIDKIQPIDCRNWGLNFSDEEVHDKHRDYINRIIVSDFYA
jgi:glycosyltransferase involved in cell wall biosynthesis